MSLLHTPGSDLPAKPDPAVIKAAYEALLLKVSEAIHVIDCDTRPCPLEVTIHGRYARYAAAAIHILMPGLEPTP
jgi:hypothetical protein